MLALLLVANRIGSTDLMPNGLDDRAELQWHSHHPRPFGTASEMVFSDACALSPQQVPVAARTVASLGDRTELVPERVAEKRVD